MCKIDLKSGDTRIDPCMRNLITNLKTFGIKTVACCCGHGKYPMTIVVKFKPGSAEHNLELCHTLILRNKKKFYKRDADGHYFIPMTTAQPNEDKFVKNDTFINRITKQW